MQSTTEARKVGIFQRMVRNRYFNQISRRAEKFWTSRWYFPALLIVATAFLLLDQQVLGVAVMALADVWLLLFCPDALAALCPFMMLFIFAGPEYGDLSVFLPCAPLGAVLILAAVLHLFLYPEKIRVGRSGFGLVLMTLATALGGMGVISAKDYFRPMSIYYILGLGGGLLILYILFRSQLAREKDYSLRERFMAILYTLGLTTVSLVLACYVHHFGEFIANRGVLDFACRNFCATMLLTTLCAPIYFARKSRWHLAVCGLFEVTLVLTGSRSAILFGGVLTLLCCIYLVRYGVVSRKLMLILGTCAVAIVAVFGIKYLPEFYGSRLTDDPGGFLLGGNSRRLRLWACGVHDFLRHPLFGVGLGNSCNAEVFLDASGGMTFYHNVVLQAAGSMGVLGIIAYAWQLRNRIVLLRREKSAFTTAVAMSYLGMLMVSMTNPGIICPLPNAALMMVAFAVIEAATDDTALPITKLRPLQRKSTVVK